MSKVVVGRQTVLRYGPEETGVDNAWSTSSTRTCVFVLAGLHLDEAAQAARCEVRSALAASGSRGHGAGQAGVL